MELNLVKLKELSETKEPLKYKELCRLLNLKYYKGGGTAKNKQLERLASICDFHINKKPTRYIIDKYPIESELDKRYYTFTIIEQIDIERYKVRCDCGNTFIAPLCDIKKNKFGLCLCQWREKFKSKNTFTLSPDGTYYIGTDTNGNTFLFSVEDYDRVSKHTWQVLPSGYVGGWVTNRNMLMHRFIMEEELKEHPDLEVDHIFHARNDNRKEKLRLVTRLENIRNKRPPKRKNKKSSEQKKNLILKQKQNPISKICLYQITEYPELGYFKTKEEAQQRLDEIKLNEKE